MLESERWKKIVQWNLFWLTFFSFFFFPSHAAGNKEGFLVLRPSSKMFFPEKKESLLFWRIFLYRDDHARIFWAAFAVFVFFSPPLRVVCFVWLARGPMQKKENFFCGCCHPYDNVWSSKMFFPRKKTLCFFDAFSCIETIMREFFEPLLRFLFFSLPPCESFVLFDSLKAQCKKKKTFLWVLPPLR